MTQRKPVDQPWESWIERQIREAQERGEFDDLPGAGKPLPGYGEPYDPDWWLKSLLEREKLQVLPDTLQLQKDVEKELARIASLGTEAAVRRELEKLNATIRHRLARATSGPASRIGEIPIDRYIEKWRTRPRAP